MTDSYKTFVDAAVQPTDADVLLGRAPKHPGNVFLNDLVLQWYQEYEAAPIRNEVAVDGTDPTTKSKEEITTEILTTITSTRGGRFLKKDTRGRWVVATDKKKIRNKITDSFKTTRKKQKEHGSSTSFPSRPSPTKNQQQNHSVPFRLPEDNNSSDESGDDGSQGSVGAVIVDINERLRLEGYGDIIHQPSPQDVMPGRGSGPNDHPGNRRYRSLVQSYVAEFRAPNTTNGEKTEIAKKVYQSVTSNGGHFLSSVNSNKRDGEPRMAWKIMSENDALKKIKDALRYKSSTPTATQPANRRAAMNETKKEWESSAQLSHPSALASIEETMSAVSEEMEKLSMNISNGKSGRTAMLSDELGISNRTFDSNRALSKASGMSTLSSHHGLESSNRSLGSFETPFPPSSFQPTPNMFDNNDRTVSKASITTTTSDGDVSMNSGGASNAMDQDDTTTTMSVDGHSLSVNFSESTRANKNAASSSSNQPSTTQEEVGSSRAASRSLGGFFTSASAKSQGSDASSSNQRGSHTQRSLEEFMVLSANQSTGDLSRASMSTSTASH